MSTKKAILLASMALALVTFAVPTNASAATTITHNGVAINDQIIEATGAFHFELAGTGMECTKVLAKVTVNVDTVELTEFKVENPTSTCDFFGLIYGGCQFEDLSTPEPETHIQQTNFPLRVDLVDNKHEATITTNTSGVAGSLDAETKAQAGKTCNITTNDITILHNATNSVTVDILTTGGFISGLQLTGSVTVNSAGGASGATTTNHTSSTASIKATLNLLKPVTYTLS